MIGRGMILSIDSTLSASSVSPSKVRVELSSELGELLSSIDDLTQIWVRYTKYHVINPHLLYFSEINGDLSRTLIKFVHLVSHHMLCRRAPIWLEMIHFLSLIRTICHPAAIFFKKSIHI